MELVNPCPTAAVTFSSNPFVSPQTYALKDPNTDVTTNGFDEAIDWSATDLIQNDVLVDCGAVTFEVKQADGNALADITYASGTAIPANDVLFTDD